jgi:myosin heavy subunit
MLNLSKDSSNNQMPGESKECKNNGLLALIGLLVVISAAGWYLYFTAKEQTVKTVTQLVEVNSEKDEVTNELKELIVQYEDLKTDNDEVNQKLSAEQSRIEALLEELKTVKSNNHYQISKYKKELSTLREIMKSYIFQIDSLNTLNVNLRKENSSVTEENSRISSKNKELEELTSNLSSTVEKAAVLRAINISAVALNKKGKETAKVNKSEKIKVCFTLAENTVAPAGNQLVYMRLVSPSGQVLGASGNVVNINGTDIHFSDKREVEYGNKDIDVCIFWAKTNELVEGEYQVELVSRGSVIGKSSIYLK